MQHWYEEPTSNPLLILLIDLHTPVSATRQWVARSLLLIVNIIIIIWEIFTLDILLGITFLHSQLLSSQLWDNLWLAGAVVARSWHEINVDHLTSTFIWNVLVGVIPCYSGCNLPKYRVIVRNEQKEKRVKFVLCFFPVCWLITLSPVCIVWLARAPLARGTN